MIFYIKNKSSVFGGQEKYASQIIKLLEGKGHHVQFSGTPKTISSNTRIIDMNNIDITILNGNSSLYQYLFKKIPGKFIVYVQHSNINDNQSSNWKKIVRQLILRFMFFRVDLIIRVCDNALPSHYSKNKIITIYNGVSLPNKINTVRFNAPFRILMVGALTENKNHKLALTLLSKNPELFLTIVGNGSELESLKKMATELRITDRVNFAGFHDDLSSYYENSDLLLMLSYYEAFPYAVIEAMSYGCPVLSVRVGGVPEIIKDNINGWLLNDYSIQSLNQKILEIKSKPKEYITISTEARKTITLEFTEEIMIDKLISSIKNRY